MLFVLEIVAIFWRDAEFWAPVIGVGFLATYVFVCTRYLWTNAEKSICSYFSSLFPVYFLAIYIL